MIATAVEMILHNSILAEEKNSFLKLYNTYVEEILVYLYNKFQEQTSADKTCFYDAIHDGLMGYFSKPTVFDPQKSSLKGFLRMACERDLINYINKENRKKNKLKIVELKEELGNSIIEQGLNPEDILINTESKTIENQGLSQIFNNELDIELAKLIRSKERRTEFFSILLKIEHLPIKDQRTLVKKHKDRIKKRLKDN